MADASPITTAITHPAIELTARTQEWAGIRLLTRRDRRRQGCYPTRTKAVPTKYPGCHQTASKPPTPVGQERGRRLAFGQALIPPCMARDPMQADEYLICRSVESRGGPYPSI